MTILTIPAKNYTKCEIILDIRFKELYYGVKTSQYAKHIIEFGGPKTMNDILNDATHKSRIEKIKVAMALADHTKTKLAELLKIDRNTLNHKLKGKSPWSINEIEQLAQIYDKPRHYFF